MKAMDSEGNRGIPRELYFWSRSNWQGGRSPVRKAQNKDLTVALREFVAPRTERELSLRRLARSESSICYGTRIQVLLSLFFFRPSLQLGPRPSPSGGER